MFVPDREFKRLVNSGRARAAYIYPDGIEVWEVRRVKSGRYATEINVNHFWPCQIRIVSRDYSEEWGGGPMTCAHLVCHTPRVLLGGVSEVTVNYGIGSQLSKERGLRATSIYLDTPAGARYELLNVDCMHSDVQPLPEYFNYYGTAPSDSIKVRIARCKNDLENVEVHGILEEDPVPNPV